MKFSEEECARQRQANEMHELKATLEEISCSLDEAREAARWLLPFTISSPASLREALERWPWLAMDQPNKE